MSYQVLARRWRPRRFDEVVGQKGVTQTLRNAIGSGRLAHSYVFAGPRGVGKTTTARILARCLNCVNGPTADPCGTCEACVEIAEGRDMDVQEIDAATHTQVDSVRSVIIEPLYHPPARDRFKIFIIDEVHRLSKQSFDALLKSIEEPPPHVVFMMATTELDKVPATIQSRSQVFELRSIGTAAIRDQLRKIAGADQLEIDDLALALIARAAEGSMRDAQSALDQVIAFAGSTVSAGDVAAVLGLVGRDLLYEIAGAIADEDAAAIFALAERATESGNDLKLVCRELARLMRDMLVVTLDPARLNDPDIAPEPERESLKALAARFSPEDLLRAFDVLSRAEFEVRSSAQPRYHLEMALLKLVHLRKLMPIADLLAGTTDQARGQRPEPRGLTPAAAPPLSRAAAAPAPSQQARGQRPEARGTTPPAAPAPSQQARGQRLEATGPKTAPRPAAPLPTGKKPVPQSSEWETVAEAPAAAPSDLKGAILAELQKRHKTTYGMLMTMAERVELEGDAIVISLKPQQKLFDAQRQSIETVAASVAGRKIGVRVIEGKAAAKPSADAARQDELKKQAMAQPSVQSLIDVFGADIQEVEEIDR